MPSGRKVCPSLIALYGSKLTTAVIAAATFGAVVRSRDQNFTVGDGKDFDGRRARTPEQLSALQKYSDVLLDYCHFGDPMCAVGSTPESVEAHLDYFVEHNAEVITYMVGMAKAATNGHASNGTTPSRPQPSGLSSVIAKPATGSATPTSLSASATHDSGAQPAQSGASGSTNGSTGAAASLMVHAALLVGVGAVMLQAAV